MSRGSVPLGRCDHGWRETLATLFRALSAPRDRLAFDPGDGVPREAIALRSARSAVVLALRSACPGGGEAILPSFTCRALLDAVCAAGLAPRFVDIRPDLSLDPEGLEAAAAPGVRAVILPHAFGAPGPSGAVEAFCRGRGLLMVDDAASSALVPGEGGPVGTRGDFGVISLAQQKSLVAGQGGLLLCNSDRARAALGSPRLPRPPRFASARAALLWCWQDLHPARFPRLLHRVVRLHDRLFGRIPDPPLEPQAMPGVYAAVLRIQRRRGAELLQRRRETARSLAARLAPVPGCEVPQGRDPGPVVRLFVRFPGIRWGDDGRGHFTSHPLAEHLRARGIEAARPYAPLHWAAEARDGVVAPLPVTERIVPELVALPLQGRLGPLDLDRIAEAVASFPRG